VGFFLKKAVSFFIEPLGMILLLSLLGLLFLFKKRENLAKIYFTLSFLFLFFYSYPPVSNFLVKNLEENYTKYDYNQKAIYIHVLGSGHRIDDNQPISSSLTTNGTKRVIEGVMIHKKLANSKLVFTGYKGHTSISNALMNKRFAIALGVEEKDIILNKKAKDTMEEAIFMKSLLKDDDERFILVTSASHMHRAMMLFKSIGLNPIPAPTDFYGTTTGSFLTPPNIGALSISQMAIHEYLGILWAKLQQFLH